MSEETIETESSETLETTPESTESASQSESSGAVEQQAQPVTQEEKPAPFHEHPRFKELIEQNRESKASAEKYQQELTRLQYELQTVKQQFTPKKEDPVDPFIRDLEKVNPEYATYMRNLQTQAARAETVEKQFQQYQAQQFAEKAYSHFDGLLSSNKIEDPVDKELYKSAVEAEVYRREAKGERLGLKDLDTIFTSFHTKYAKYNEDRERAITAKYLSSKKADQSPTPTTGGAATSPTMKKFSSMDSPEAISWVAQELRRAKRQE